jgi:flagella basal body P-ring formation protein FlgA
MRRLLNISILAAAFLTAAVLPAAAAERTIMKEAEIRRIVIDYIRQKTEYSGVDIRLKDISFNGDISVPAGKVAYDLVSSQEWEGWGRGSLALIIRVNDRVEKNIPINVEVEALAEMVIATRPLEFGSIVKKEDVALQKRDLATAQGKVCRTLDEVIGKRVRVAMRGNSTVKSDYLEKPPLVKNGQMVTIIAENESFRLTATGRAKGNGAAGDTVIVQTMNSRKDVPALVLDANTVRVEF